MLHPRWQNGKLWADVVGERVDGSLALQLANLSAMAASEIVGGDCVRDLDLDPSLTWASVVDFLVCYYSLVLPR